jgi:uncharacterized protein (TIGR02117 family)
VGFMTLVGLYILAHIVLATLPARWSSLPSVGKVSVFVKTDGFHTDLILPTRNASKDWSKDIHVAQDISYMAFGWGDRGFYIDTPTASEFQVSTALKALFYLGTSVVHINHYQEVTENNQCKKMELSVENYQKLVRFIEQTFAIDTKGNYIPIQSPHYSKRHLFFEAKGSYSLFYTCNTWVVEALKSCQQPTCMWTPFASGIFYHLP